MSPQETFPGKLALQQRVLPAYRAPFFDELARACEGGLHIFAGQPLPIEALVAAEELEIARFTSAHNRHLFHPRHPLYLCWQGGLVEWLKDSDPDALIVEANPRYPATRQAIEWMHRRGRPVLGWGLGAPPIGGPFTLWHTHSRSRFLGSLDGLIAYSRRGAKEYRALGILPSKRIFAAPNAVTPRPPSLSPSLSLSPPPLPSLLFVGRLQTRKRVDNLLRACAALPENLQPQLVIVGDGPARQKFQTLAKTVYPRAEFVGAKHGPELAPYFAAAGLFVLPGTGGLAVQQAMSHGLPVIVAQGDGTQDDLVRPGNGWQVPPGDLPSLKCALEEALTNPARLREMGAESYRIVAEEINLETMAAVFVRAINHST
ncbi:MAG: glycosyltransferase family 4 protein [Anaerolineales bacterium]